MCLTVVKYGMFDFKCDVLACLLCTLGFVEESGLLRSIVNVSCMLAKFCTDLIQLTCAVVLCLIHLLLAEL